MIIKSVICLENYIDLNKNTVNFVIFLVSMTIEGDTTHFIGEHSETNCNSKTADHILSIVHFPTTYGVHVQKKKKTLDKIFVFILKMLYFQQFVSYSLISKGIISFCEEINPDF